MSGCSEGVGGDRVTSILLHLERSEIVVMA